MFIYIYIRCVADIVLLCECSNLLQSFIFCVCGAEGGAVAAPGHLGSLGQEPQAVSGHFGHASVVPGWAQQD